MGPDKRKDNRVVFERGIAVRIMALDGTWSHDVTMEDVSAKGAKLTLEHPLERTMPKEFFLALSSTGKVFRRCEVAWVNGSQLGASFVTRDDPTKGRKPARRPASD